MGGMPAGGRLHTPKSALEQRIEKAGRLSLWRLVHKHVANNKTITDFKGQGFPISSKQHKQAPRPALSKGFLNDATPFPYQMNHQGAVQQQWIEFEILHPGPCWMLYACGHTRPKKQTPLVLGLHGLDLAGPGVDLEVPALWMSLSHHDCKKMFFKQ